MLDSIIRSLSLTLVDADDPTATMFLPGTVPVVPADQHETSWFGYQPLVDSYPDTRQADPCHLPSPSPTGYAPRTELGCSCKALTLGEHWPATSEHAPMWGPTPAWNDSWSESDIRKESIRRLCWSAMITAAGHISYTTAHRSYNPDLFIADPANVGSCSLFFDLKLTFNTVCSTFLWRIDSKVTFVDNLVQGHSMGFTRSLLPAMACLYTYEG
jgi:hypothetical protein